MDVRSYISEHAAGFFGDLKQWLAIPSTREGGSGPEADLTEILGAPLLYVAAGLNSDRIHAPNEKVEMAMLLKGAETVAYLWDELAEASLGAGPR